MARIGDKTLAVTDEMGTVYIYINIYIYLRFGYLSIHVKEELAKDIINVIVSI
jgi:hypothetical protein